MLVTHALHFLPSVDYIICIDGGKIRQQGTYEELIADHDGAFAELVRDFGGGAQEKKEKEEEDEGEAIETEEEPKKEVIVKKALMQEEERNRGAVSGQGACVLLTRGCGCRRLTRSPGDSVQKIPSSGERPYHGPASPLQPPSDARSPGPRCAPRRSTFPSLAALTVNHKQVPIGSFTGRMSKIVHQHTLPSAARRTRLARRSSPEFC